MEGNYDRSDRRDFEFRVARSVRAFADYCRGLDEERRRRDEWRRAYGVKVVAFLGYGRAGKDTAAEMFCRAAGLTYGESSSRVVLPIIADTLGLPPERAWAERHQNREYWIDWCHTFRGGDYTRLVRMALGRGDVLVGVRGALELQTACLRGLYDLGLWVARPGVPADPTVEFSPADCDLVVENGEDLAALSAKMTRLARCLPKRRAG